MLHIRAVKESLHGCGYTSARLKTRKRDGSARAGHAEDLLAEHVERVAGDAQRLALAGPAGGGGDGGLQQLGLAP